MSYLFFMDESGHDHNNCPYEVRGGIAIHSTDIESFVRDIWEAEEKCFGSRLLVFGSEMKGSKLLDRKRFRFSRQGKRLGDVERRHLCQSFLRKGSGAAESGAFSSPLERAAYGQASLLMASEVFSILIRHNAVLFASMIPRGTKCLSEQADGTKVLMRKDFVFLFERYFYFLEAENEDGLIVMDQSDDSADHMLTRQMDRYFNLTQTGRHRAARVVPIPFFVASHMVPAIQAADMCLYCINWGFRHGQTGIDADVRQEIMDGYSVYLRKLQFHGEKPREDGTGVYPLFGITLVRDPYNSRKEIKKRDER